MIEFTVYDIQNGVTLGYRFRVMLDYFSLLGSIVAQATSGHYPQLVQGDVPFWKSHQHV